MAIAPHGRVHVRRSKRLGVSLGVCAGTRRGVSRVDREPTRAHLGPIVAFLLPGELACGEIRAFLGGAILVALALAALKPVGAQLADLEHERRGRPIAARRRQRPCFARCAAFVALCRRAELLAVAHRGRAVRRDQDWRASGAPGVLSARDPAT
jgi:hypothetical protein